METAAVRIEAQCTFDQFFPVQPLKPLVVHNFMRSSCNASDIDKTKRLLETRVCEHAGISDCTGKVVTALKDSLYTVIIP